MIITEAKIPEISLPCSRLRILCPDKTDYSATWQFKIDGFLFELDSSDTIKLVSQNIYFSFYDGIDTFYITEVNFTIDASFFTFEWLEDKQAWNFEFVPNEISKRLAIDHSELIANVIELFHLACKAKHHVEHHVNVALDEQVKTGKLQRFLDSYNKSLEISRQSLYKHYTNERASEFLISPNEADRTYAQYRMKYDK